MRLGGFGLDLKRPAGVVLSSFRRATEDFPV
uniref:Uncharacterized protein n=1 Tax=Physcomitrium patens TaxID=3218 RepID=A0A2K1KUD0_PHYPA|nr:hypothetical protein PHYPA_004391 [Physcomitrium patens]